jgi:inner membrane protein
LNGSAHSAIGAATGFIVANVFQTEPTTTLLFVGLGAVTGLIPDIDIDGKLSNKITFSHKIIRTIAQVIGFLMIIYSFLEGTELERWIGMGVGAAIIMLSSFLRQRHMLTVTGVGVFIGGVSLQDSWLWLLGIYIILASFVPHRSYTHSLLGLMFFGVIAKQFEASIGVDGVFIVCILGYGSHLIADMKLLPFNKRGTKFFLPFSSKEL